MRFNSSEGCLSGLHPRRLVDAVTIDYPWNHGVTGNFLSPDSAHHPRAGVYVKTPIQESVPMCWQRRYCYQDTKIGRRGNSSPA